MKHRMARVLVVVIFTAALLLIGKGQSFPGLGGTPAIAQLIRTEGIWRQVYEKLPDLPKENQYISKDTGKVASEDTLVGRLIRYHLYTKQRLPFSRLDWKLTFADYLGVYGLLTEADYPSQAKLTKSPMENDVAAIRRLNRVQRDALIQTLVDVFASQKRPAQPTPKPLIQLPKG
jgi:hypothetical protein